MANKYYTVAGKTVANLDESDETDINDINTAVEAACDLIEDDIAAVGGAREWAVTEEDTLVPTTAGGNGVDEYSGLHYAAKADGSATDAFISKIAAANSAASAVTSAVAAGNAETNAETAQAAAELAETNAAASAATIPTISGGDAYKVIQVNAGETAYEQTTSARIDIAAADGTQVFSNGTDGTDATFTGNVTGNADTADDADTIDGIEATNLVKFPGSGGLNTKVIDIGDWDMDANGVVTVSHGLTLGKIRSVSFIIRSDAALNFYQDGWISSDGSTVDLWVDNITTTDIVCTRRSGSPFDAAGFDSTSFNRGWITIQYVD